MKFHTHKTFRKIGESRLRTLLLEEGSEAMSQEFSEWIDCAMHHGNGPSVPRVMTTVTEYDDEGNIVHKYSCTESIPRRCFIKKNVIKELEMDYVRKVKLQ